MTDAPALHRPAQTARRLLDIIFTDSFELLAAYEPAVGQHCRVIRRRHGRVQECDGIVRQVEPLEVSLAGAGFQ